MYRLLITLMFFTGTVSLRSQNYLPTDQGSKVHFLIKNFGINTGGDLTGLKGNISFNPTNPSASQFDVTVEANTINTDNGNRDEHLRSPDYFDAEKFPEIRIQSTKIDATNKSSQGMYYFTGNLTMHGVTRSITFPFTAKKAGDGFIFAGEFDINRLDFNVGESSSVLSKTVKVSLLVNTKKL